MKWVRFDTENEQTWPKQNGQYLIVFACGYITVMRWDDGKAKNPKYSRPALWDWPVQSEIYGWMEIPKPPKRLWD